MPVGQPEFVDNPEPRCPVVLLLDTSSSMTGLPIQELNNGISIFKQSVQSDPLASLRVELSIISFGGETPTVIQDFIMIDEFNPPTLVASGRTPIGQAINLALDNLEARKQLYRDNNIQYYQPWLFMITDGSPTDPPNIWQEAARRIEDAENDQG